MGCLGVLFAVDTATAEKVRRKPRRERPEYISSELEEDYFVNHRSETEELDKAWDAIHRVLTDGSLLFGDACYPLSGVILGGEVLYGDEAGEDDYIITLKLPEQVKAIAEALPKFDQAEARRRYFAFDEVDYGFPMDEQDFGYTWAYLTGSIDFWKRAAEKGYSVLFTADQ